MFLSIKKFRFLFGGNEQTIECFCGILLWNNFENFASGGWKDVCLLRSSLLEGCLKQGAGSRE